MTQLHDTPMQTLDRLKAKISPGDSVHFEFRGQRLCGTVSAFGRKCAGITVLDGTHYRIPYQRVQPLAAAKDHSAQEQGALELGRRMLHKHNLREWSLGLDDATRRAAACDYKAKRISLSRLFIRGVSEHMILDAILHEIAHALAGFEHHHDAVWQKIARQIGCSGERCHNINFSPPRWIMQCPSGCFSATRNRRMRGLVCKKCLQPIRFVAWTKELSEQL